MSYEFNMVDMGGIDIATVNGTVVDGLYNKLLEGKDTCGNLILYNWKFAEIEIVPSACSVLIEDEAIIVNGTIRVSSEDVVSLIWADPPPAPVSPLIVNANGIYTAEPPASGFNPVTVHVPHPPTVPIVITENGTYSPPPGVFAFSSVTAKVSGGMSDNDLLFHFDDFTNSGKMNAAFYSKTGYLISDEQSKFGGTSLKVNSVPSFHAVYFEDGFTIGDRDFTLDFWAYTTSTMLSQCPISFDYRSLGYYVSSEVKRGVSFAYSSGSWSYEGDSQVYSLNILNSWHHFAITRSGSTFHVFTDGIEEDTFEWDHAFAPMTRLSFGTNSAVEAYWRGYIDEFRLKIGEAVWTSNFTPPAEPYT